MLLSSISSSQYQTTATGSNQRVLKIC